MAGEHRRLAVLVKDVAPAFHQVAETPERDARLNRAIRQQDGLPGLDVAAGGFVAFVEVDGVEDVAADPLVHFPAEVVDEALAVGDLARRPPAPLPAIVGAGTATEPVIRKVHRTIAVRLNILHSWDAAFRVFPARAVITNLFRIGRGEQLH